MKLTQNPVDLLVAGEGGAALVTGVEPIPRLNGDGVRVFLGSRWLNVHVHVVDPAQADTAVTAWVGTLGHLFATDVDPDTLCRCGSTPTTPATPN